jgi:hypothetical protein
MEQAPVLLYVRLLKGPRGFKPLGFDQPVQQAESLRESCQQYGRRAATVDGLQLGLTVAPMSQIGDTMKGITNTIQKLP